MAAIRFVFVCESVQEIRQPSVSVRVLSRPIRSLNGGEKEQNNKAQ